MAIPIY
ncbi:hypothetical protein VTL71DRAFT_15544 [Oculimacula yallundae]